MQAVPLVSVDGLAVEVAGPDGMDAGTRAVDVVGHSIGRPAVVAVRVVGLASDARLGQPRRPQEVGQPDRACIRGRPVPGRDVVPRGGRPPAARAGAIVLAANGPADSGHALFLEEPEHFAAVVANAIGGR